MNQRFEIGEKVVCVNANPGLIPCHDTDPLTVGMVYVIRDIQDETGVPFGVRLLGMNTGTCDDGEEGFWRAHRFRKLSEVKAKNRRQSKSIKA